MSKAKSIYKVIILNASGKREEVTVEANRIMMLDAIDDSLVCFNNITGTVFAIPFRNLVSATKLPATEPTKPTAIRPTK